MTKKKYIALLAAACVALIAVPVAATPPSGISGPFIARGVAVDKVKTRGNEPFDVVVQDLTIAPGGHTGWHTHPGMAIAVVTAGTLTIYDAKDRSCTGHEYGAGEVYVDSGYGHVHIGRNEGSTTLEIIVTYIDVPIGGAVRIDAADPGTCPF
jgi:quercetin dioxygenase-like cupin family protein